MPETNIARTGNYWTTGRRFAPKPDDPPVPETTAADPVVQEPMDGDDRTVASTTRRFRVWIDGLQRPEAVESTRFEKIWREFGIDEPTVLDLREALSSCHGPGQVRVVQLKNPNPTDPDDARNAADHDPYGHLEPDDVLDRVMNPQPIDEAASDPWDVPPAR